jgi:hypothetical protein
MIIGYLLDFSVEFPSFQRFITDFQGVMFYQVLVGVREPSNHLFPWALTDVTTIQWNSITCTFKREQKSSLLKCSLNISTWLYRHRSTPIVLCSVIGLPIDLGVWDIKSRTIVLSFLILSLLHTSFGGILTYYFYHYYFFF